MKQFARNKIATAIKPRERGYILYEGPSQLDGEPIVAIMTMITNNAKTGDMVQLWIIRSDINPVEASKLGQDSSICGNCPQRHHTGGACYVNIGQAPNQVYKSFKRGIYPVFDYAKHSQYITGRKIRLGAYGDPAAIPFNIVEPFAKLGIGHTGYTHQANHKGFDDKYFSLLMASADTPKQSLALQSRGAKTFRVALADDSLFEHEAECFADSEGIQCADCLQCDGKHSNIAIQVHGSRKSNFKSSLIDTITIAA
tara:strand:- start:311 stop:1075 length:765 start_codon:yes stop_codon:yes gene_type:complete